MSRFIKGHIAKIRVGFTPVLSLEFVTPSLDTVKHDVLTTGKYSELVAI